jgi:hypothetical protein
VSTHEFDTGHCPCGAPLPPRNPRGPRALYCSSRCRNRASRARRATFAPPDPIAAAEPVEAFLVDGREAPTDDQVLAAVHELVLLAAAFRRLGSEARGPFAWRCAKTADDLETTLSRYFPMPGA